MNQLLFLPRIFYKIYFFVVFAFSLIIMYPLFYWATVKKSRFPIAFKLMKFWAAFMQIAFGIWLQIEGKEQIPKNQNFVFCSNHSSYLDIIMMYRVLSDYFVMMGKQEIKDWPLFNRFFTTGMNILVPRENMQGAVKALEQAKVELDNNRIVVIFPEGGIPDFKTPKMKGFKNGAFKMAIEKQVPILPVTFETNWKIFEGTLPLKGKAGPGICKVIIHRPISTKGLTSEDMIPLRNKTREIINQPLLKYIKTK